MPDFHVAFRNLLHAVNLRHGTDGFTSPPKEGMLRIFSPWKIRRFRPGLNPRTWVPKASKCVFWFYPQILPPTSHSNKNHARYQKRTQFGLHGRGRYFCYIWMELEFYRFSKNTQISNYTEIRQMAAELLHADGRTDMTKLFAILHKCLKRYKPF